MQHITLLEKIRETVSTFLNTGKSIGFVPTMGYLHEGHLSLVRKARAENDIVITSVFVNPTQFVPGEDYERYPRDEDRDRKLLEQEGVDVLFIPTSNTIYPEHFSTYIQPPKQSEGWCGASRPGHFRGVCTIVGIFFNLVQPTRAYFGQKDAQQAAVIKQMTNDLRFPVDIIVCPIIREEDGLAMSSRNVYLSTEERKNALVLYESLKQGLVRFQNGEKDAETIINDGKQRITSTNGVQLDYLSIVDQNTFESVNTVSPNNLYIGAIKIGKTRLIDNMLFE